MQVLARVKVHLLSATLFTEHIYIFVPNKTPRCFFFSVSSWVGLLPYDLPQPRGGGGPIGTYHGQPVVIPANATVKKYLVRSGR